ncbi:MAG TPA: ATP-binding protein [Mycobacteriales bacterium]|jgi:PAS domain S-box-containing protein|nr:ATP-binding protein [Mycobacteriales bacterium]
MAVKLYVGAIALLAGITASLAAFFVPASHHVGPESVTMMIGLIAFTEYLQIRYYHHDEVDALNLMEGMLAPVLFVSSGAGVALVTAIGVALGNLFRRNDGVKLLFNMSQWVLCASVGSLVLHALSTYASSSAQMLGALSVALLAASATNILAMSGVLTVVAGSPIGSRDRSKVGAVAIGHAIGIGASLVSGICLTSAYLWTHWTLLIGFIFIGSMYLSGRANASLRADGVRLAGLQRATHALATSLQADEAIPVFLREARAGFEVRTVQLVLFNGGESEVYTTGEPVGADCAHTFEPHELADVLVSVVKEPSRFNVGIGDVYVSAALERTGHQRCLAAPLRSGSRSIGMLLLYDRFGMEGFEHGELSIAAALARELVGFLERVELLAEIDAERRKLTEILESTSDGILTIDADGVITSWNAGLAGITGYPATEMLGTRHFGLLRPRDAGGRDVLIERWQEMFESSSGLPAELQIVSAQGDSIWMSCSYSRIAASEERADTLVIVARNITQARELERLKDDFVAVVSHELRTPLVPIKGWAQTLINRGDRLSDDQRRTAVQSILAQAQKLESLVLNILEASRIESGRIDGDGVADVAGVTMRIVEDTLAARPDRVVRVRPPSVPCQVRGSSVWVERAVSNLVANAVKYSPDDEAVDVAVFAEGGDIVVTVTDRGPGIAADAQERIFERFERLEETMKQTGTGLGLYITRRLARAMGGDVTVSSVPGAGSTFLLRLPAAPVTATKLPEQRPSDAPRLATGGHDGTVLHLR